MCKKNQKKNKKTRNKPSKHKPQSVIDFNNTLAKIDKKKTEQTLYSH